jgi:hypothetical protein
MGECSSKKVRFTTDKDNDGFISENSLNHIGNSLLKRNQGRV